MIKYLYTALLALYSAISSLDFYQNNQIQNQPINQSTQEPSTQEIYKAWVYWIDKFEKQYLDQEGPLKWINFADNYRYIVHTNAQNLTYKVGINQYSDLTNEEFSNLINGLSISSKNVNKKYKKLSTLNLPSAVDWVSQGAVTPIKNQGNCGSYWAFSTTGGLEGLNFLKTGNLLNFSEQQIIDCSKTFSNKGCDGGLPDWAYSYTATNGIQEESTYPYEGIDDACRYNKSLVSFKNDGYADVMINSPTQLKAAVAQQPISVLIEADQPSFKNYESGILNDPNCFSGGQINMAGLVVGYDQQNGNNYWVVKNSWGTSWGQNGYVWIYYDPQVNDSGVCGINSSPSYPI